MNSFHPNVWYPFTIQQDAPKPLKVTSGDGIWLQLDDGRRIMDAISSWWVNLYGHAHPKISRAISEQARQLEQVIFANFTHQPAETVAEELARRLPGTLERTFFSDDGSTAVEVALKTAFQYWKNRGDDRKSFICFEGAYHGDTFGAMSAGARSGFTEVFNELLFDVDFVRFPDEWIGQKNIQQKEMRVISAIEEMLQKNPNKYAGILIEPLVQGAAGMRVCRPEFLKKLRQCCDTYNTLLIFDEVMTGFGRTGEAFACTKAGVTPDIISLAKGLTGGFLPLSVTVSSAHVYEVFNNRNPQKAFWHGHSYTANPLGCAAAIASFELLDEHQPVYANMEQTHRLHLERFLDHPAVKKVRACGTIAAMEFVTEQKDGYLNTIAQQIKQQSIEHGVLLRPLGNTVYLMPPYCVTDDQLATMYDVIEKMLTFFE